MKKSLLLDAQTAAAMEQTEAAKACVTWTDGLWSKTAHMPPNCNHMCINEWISLCDHATLMGCRLSHSMAAPLIIGNSYSTHKHTVTDLLSMVHAYYWRIVQVAADQSCTTAAGQEHSAAD